MEKHFIVFLLDEFEHPELVSGVEIAAAFFRFKIELRFRARVKVAVFPIRHF